MIRKFEEKDLEKIMEIWLDSNIKAHHFIDKNYWKENFEFVKSLIPQSEVYIFEKEKEICGFIGVAEQNYIAGIFVKEIYQGQGVGKKLLDFIKTLKTELYLNVYDKNIRAKNFYFKNGFELLEEKISENEKDLLLIWKCN